jgi:hypothetical protein
MYEYEYDQVFRVEYGGSLAVNDEEIGDISGWS